MNKPSKRIRNSARGEDCDLMIHPYCHNNSETVVLCHLPSEAKGMGKKSPDFWAVYGCFDCHEIIDGKRRVDLSPHEIVNCMMRGLFRTQNKLIEKGLMRIL